MKSIIKQKSGEAGRNAIILNGADGKDTASAHIHTVLVEELAAVSWNVTSFTLETLRIAPCLGCFGCWTKSPGVCRMDDDGRKIARAAIRSDVMILFTPVTFGGYSAELKKALDRLLCLLAPFFVRIHGEVHHGKRYERYPGLLGIGILDQPDSESERIFKTLVHRNALNLHAPTHNAAVLHTGRKMEEYRDTIRWLRTTMEGIN
jgi:hypothetical protein